MALTFDSGSCYFNDTKASSKRRVPCKPALPAACCTQLLAAPNCLLLHPVAREGPLHARFACSLPPPWLGGCPLR
jgi:hypothetical protein